MTGSSKCREKQPTVLMVSTLPPSRDGVAIYSHDLIRALYLIGIEVTCLSNASAKNNRIKTCEKFWAYSSVTYPFTILREALRSCDDIVHIQHEFFLYGYGFSAVYILLPLIILRFLHRKIVITMHQVFSTSKVNDQFVGNYFVSARARKHLRLLIKIFFHLLGLCASLIIVHLPHMKQILISDYHVNNKKIVVIPHGVREYTQISADEKNLAKKALGLTGRKVLLVFGFITPRKGLENVILAMHKLVQSYSDINLLIVGTVPQRAGIVGEKYLLSLKRMCAKNKLNNNVRFVGFIQEDEIPTYFKAADALILPYLDSVSMSGTLKLAIAFQCPIVSTNLRFIREEAFLSGVTPHLVPPGDVVALTHAIENTLKKTSVPLVHACMHSPTFAWKDAAMATSALYEALKGM